MHRVNPIPVDGQMELAILLAGWILVSALVCRWPKKPWLAFALVLSSLAVSHFWGTFLWAWAGREPLPLEGIDAAYLSLWALVLIPILRRDLSLAALRASLTSGLVAVAAFGLAQDAIPLVLLGFAGRLEPAGIEGAIHTALVLAGLGLRLSLNHPPGPFPWEYLAWYLGLLTMSQAR